MSEFEQLIAAIAKIADDPQAWLRAVGNVQEVREKLAEANRTKKEAEAAAKAAATDLETARTERAQGDRAMRDAAAQNAANAVRERDLRGLETQLKTQRETFEREAANAKQSLDQRERDLDLRERLAAKKLNDAEKLMASYDEAKHKAALKLAS
jgi:hypothetical protein